MNYLVVIPARFQSTRLPGKPLIPLLGIPMILRTYQQCVKVVNSDHILVATDDDRIRIFCELNNIRVLMTSPDCLTGTDRVTEVAQIYKADIYINIQGDEPVFNPEDLQKLIVAAKNYPNDVLNGYCKIDTEDIFYNPNIPKVVMRPDGRLLYMSRGPIPNNKKNIFKAAFRQVCAYSFPQHALIMLSNAPKKTYLEEMEDIEILRFLELGVEVRMIEMTNSSISVDIPSDIFRVEQAILLSRQNE